jgi:pimeloyl-ACP methyl ester carboxylesterase
VGVNLLRNSGAPNAFTEDDLNRYVESWSKPRALTSMVDWYRAALRARPARRRDVRVHVPTLLIWGAKDIALRPEMAQESIDRCDDGKLLVFEEATHWVHRERTAEVSALMADFFTHA